MTNHFLSTEQITKPQLEKLLDRAAEIVANPKKFAKALDGKIVATLFFEPSTRTRLSFESAALKLGAQVISTENGNTSTSNTKGETIEDTVRTIAGYADAVVMRHSGGDSAHRAAAVSTIPIINAGSGSAHHPTQSVLDIYTIKQHRGKIDGLKIAFIGDLLYGRTANSLTHLLSLYKDVQVYTLSPEGFGFDKSVKMPYTICKSFDDIPHDIDVIYQTRVQKERMCRGERCSPEKYQITKEVLEKFSKNTIIMHPLPRVDEISTDVDDDPRALYFKQAHNGIPTRMAILLSLLA